jgi:hypothetical protein
MSDQVYINIDGDNVTPVGYDNLLSRENNSTLTNEAGGDKTNILDLSGGINVFNSSVAIAPQSITLNQINISPYNEVYIPAEAMNPTTTGGCADLEKVESLVHLVNYWVLDFDKDVEESCFFTLRMPDNWNGGGITFQFIWVTTATNRLYDTVCWGIKGHSHNNSDIVDLPYGDELSVVDTWLGHNTVHLTPDTDNLILGGRPALGQWVQFKISRKVADDTLEGDARLLGVRLKYKFI